MGYCLYFLQNLLDMGSLLGTKLGTKLNYKKGPISTAKALIAVAHISISMHPLWAIIPEFLLHLR